MTNSPGRPRRRAKEGRVMGNLLWTLAVVFVALWALGLVVDVMLGGFIHVLLVLAVVAVLIKIITGRRIA